MPESNNHEKRVSPLEIPPEQFRELGYRLVDRIAAFLDALPQRPVTPGESPSVVRRALDAENPLPQQGDHPASLLDRAADLLLAHSLFNGHPRFWGYVTSSAAPIGALAEMLAAAVNPNVGAWPLSPMASEIEAQTVRWIAELLNYPVGCGGLFVSGGNMANIVCFLAARQAKAGRDVRKAGVDGLRMRVYCSTETHTWMQKAADISGIGTDAVRWIPADCDGRISVPALRAQILSDREAGEKPGLVTGNAGTVGTGAVDPLPELAALCRELDLWFHVDGAYGGLAAALPGAPAALSALHLADSIAVDPHKWLYAPLEAGCALVRDPARLRDAFAYHPPYYHFGNEAINYFDLGPQNSRGFRALKVWLALQQVGRAGYVEMMAKDIELAAELFSLLPRFPELQAFTRSLSIATFRFNPPDLARAAAEAEPYLDQLNSELLTRLQNSGEAYLSNAVVQGRFALRACIVNFRTSSGDLAALPPLVVRIGRQVDAELRPAILRAGVPDSGPPAR